MMSLYEELNSFYEEPNGKLVMHRLPVMESRIVASMTGMDEDGVFDLLTVGIRNTVGDEIVFAMTMEDVAGLIIELIVAIKAIDAKHDGADK